MTILPIEQKPNTVQTNTTHSDKRALSEYLTSTLSTALQLTFSLPPPVRADTIVIDDASIPLIDLEAIDSARGEERKALINQFGDGLKNVGFVAVKAESLTSLIGKVNEEMEKYFSLPLEEKMKDWHIDNAKGFSQYGRETATGAKNPDLKETYFIPPNFQDWPKQRNLPQTSWSISQNI
ncbi:MAG: 2-oxoglutarate and iron-dependent oxygenase domain-containing protein [Anaerolineae bacterium]